MKRRRYFICIAGLLALAALAIGCADRRPAAPEEKPAETGTELEVPDEPQPPEEPTPGNTPAEGKSESDPKTTTPAENATGEGVKEQFTGKTVRVAIRLESPSVMGAGYKVRSITTDPEAQAYQAKLKAEQEKIAHRIEEAIGHPLDVKYWFTLSTNVISANVYMSDIEKILSVDGVVSVSMEQAYQLYG